MDYHIECINNTFTTKGESLIPEVQQQVIDAVEDTTKLLLATFQETQVAVIKEQYALNTTSDFLYLLNNVCFSLF